MSREFYKACEICETSFEQLFKKYRPRLIFFAWQIVRDEFEAEDIVSEVFLKYLFKGNIYECEDAKMGFLYRCTKNECIDFLRSKKIKEREREKTLKVVDDNVDYLLNHIERKELIVKVRHIIETLPPVCKQVITLSYLKGLNRQEIAQTLNLSSRTVRNHKSRGLRWIREKFILDNEAAYTKPLALQGRVGQ